MARDNPQEGVVMPDMIKVGLELVKDAIELHRDDAAARVLLRSGTDARGHGGPFALHGGEEGS
jgi:hypothetical protein